MGTDTVISPGVASLKPPLRFNRLVVMLALAEPGVARAGMPTVSLSDVAQLRLETISFFLIGFLASSGVVWRIWNSARADFPRLPHLSYWRATGLVTLWGLLFLLVLTMISGARELMTPGAWRKQGLTYKLVEDEPAPRGLDDELELKRRGALDRLRGTLDLRPPPRGEVSPDFYTAGDPR